MKIKAGEFRVLRFDFNNQIKFLPIEINRRTKWVDAYMKHGGNRVSVRINLMINFIFPETGEEIAGILCEQKFEPINIGQKNDIEKLSRFISTLIANTEIYMQDNLPNSYNGISFANIDDKEIAQKILEQVQILKDRPY